MRSWLSVLAGALAFTLTYLLMAHGSVSSATARAEEARRCEQNAQAVKASTAFELRSEHQALGDLTEFFSAMMSASPDVSPPAIEPRKADTTDPEWSSYRRHDFSLVVRMAVLPEVPLKASDLFRHKQVNPDDVYVSLDARQVLALEVASSTDLLEQITVIQARTATTELTALIEAGLARSVTIDSLRVGSLLNSDPQRYKSIKASLNRRGLNVEDTFILNPAAFFRDGSKAFWMQARAANGMVYGARLAELPLTHESVEMRHYMIMHLCSVVMEWSKSLQLLDAEPAMEILLELSRQLAQQKV